MADVLSWNFKWVLNFYLLWLNFLNVVWIWASFGNQEAELGAVRYDLQRGHLSCLCSGGGVHNNGVCGTVTLAVNGLSTWWWMAEETALQHGESRPILKRAEYCNYSPLECLWGCMVATRNLLGTEGHCFLCFTSLKAIPGDEPTSRHINI